MFPKHLWEKTDKADRGTWSGCLMNGHEAETQGSGVCLADDPTAGQDGLQRRVGGICLLTTSSCWFTHRLQELSDTHLKTTSVRRMWVKGQARQVPDRVTLGSADLELSVGGRMWGRYQSWTHLYRDISKVIRLSEHSFHFNHWPHSIILEQW